MIDYIVIPLIAVAAYAFLLLAFISAKKSAIINSFTRFLFFSLMWVGGSLLMRTHFLNLDDIWYHVSIFGLIFFAYELIIFVKIFTGLKRTIFDRSLMVVGLIIFGINAATGIFLAPPAVEINEIGSEIFVYDVTWLVSVLVVFLTTMIFYVLKIIIQNLKEDDLKQAAIKPVRTGLIILFLGHILTILPLLKGFPSDILSGVIFVLILFYALYQNRLFRLDLLISKDVVYAFSGAISIVILINTIEPIEKFLKRSFDVGEDMTMFIAVAFTIVAFVIYRFMEKFIDRIYVSNETIRNETLKEFRGKAFSSLEVAEISRMVINDVKDTLETKEVYVLLPDSAKKYYHIINTGNPLNKVDLKFEYNNPLVNLLAKDRECLFMNDFKKLNAYKSLWTDEKKELLYLNIECFVPLMDNDELAGILMLTDKVKGAKYTYDDILFLDGMTIIASTALRKARLYEIAYDEARKDDLTQILNRKYFLSSLEELYTNKKKEMISVSIFNIDDFKLYNQLYGNAEGDRVLIAIARILEATMEGIGICARYDSKVFACVFPEYDINQTKMVTEKIVDQINAINSDSNEYKIKKVRVSCGISSIPFLAKTPKDLMNDAEQAVYYVKRNGKNSIRISTGQIVKRNELTTENESVEHKSEIFSEYAQTINALTATIDTKDHYTYNHSQNVAYYATELAYALNMDEDSVEIIREAALLHDIGKIGIDETILNKSGVLTPDERITMQGHVENSVDIIKHLPSLNYLIPAVIGHHERWDGNGYPRRVKGTDIPLFARILCVADSFDAMISKRAYKEKRTVSFAIDQIEKGAARQFDPDLAVIFVELVTTGKIKPIYES